MRQLGDDQIAAILKDANGQLPTPVLRIRDLADGQGKELRYVWKPPLDAPKTPDNKPDPNALIDVSKASLILDARTVRSKDAVDKATVDGKLSHFAMNFFGMARVEFDELKFSTGPGKKPDVTASGVELKFSNELEFLNSLRAALPADVFGTGAFLDIRPSGIRVGYQLALPAIPLGVFMLSNLALSAEVAIPFDNKPVSFRFSVSEQKHPFTVTVSLFGGGGYFSMLVDTSGVKEVEEPWSSAAARHWTWVSRAAVCRSWQASISCSRTATSPWPDICGATASSPCWASSRCPSSSIWNSATKSTTDSQWSVAGAPSRSACGSPSSASPSSSNWSGAFRRAGRPDLRPVHLERTRLA